MSIFPPRRDSQNRTGVSLFQKMQQHWENFDLSELMSLLRGDHVEPIEIVKTTKLTEDKKMPWKVGISGTSNFHIDYDKLGDHPAKALFDKLIEQGTHYLFTRTMPDGTTFRSLASHHKNPKVYDVAPS